MVSVFLTPRGRFLTAQFGWHNRLWLTSPATHRLYSLARWHHIALRHLHHSLRNPTSAVQTLNTQATAQ